MAFPVSWLQAGLTVTAPVIAVVFMAGGTKADIAANKQQLEAVTAQQKADHDKVVTNDSKLDDIKQDLADIKADIKHLVERPR